MRGEPNGFFLPPIGETSSGILKIRRSFPFQRQKASGIGGARRIRDHRRHWCRKYCGRGSIVRSRRKKEGNFEEKQLLSRACVQLSRAEQGDREAPLQTDRIAYILNPSIGLNKQISRIAAPAKSDDQPNS